MTFDSGHEIRFLRASIPFVAILVFGPLQSPATKADEGNTALLELVHAATVESENLLLQGTYELDVTEFIRTVGVSGHEELTIYRAQGTLRIKGSMRHADFQVARSAAQQTGVREHGIESDDFTSIHLEKSRYQTIVSERGTFQLANDLTGEKRSRALLSDRQERGDICCPDLSLMWFSTHPHQYRSLTDRLRVRQDESREPPLRSISEDDNMVRVQYRYALGGQFDAMASILHGGNVVSTRAVIPPTDKTPEGVVTSEKLWSDPGSSAIFPQRTYWSIKWGDKAPSNELLLKVVRRVDLDPNERFPSPSLTAFGALSDGTRVRTREKGRVTTYWIGRNLDDETNTGETLNALSEKLRESDFLKP